MMPTWLTGTMAWDVLGLDPVALQYCVSSSPHASKSCGGLCGPGTRAAGLYIGGLEREITMVSESLSTTFITKARSVLIRPRLTNKYYWPPCNTLWKAARREIHVRDVEHGHSNLCVGVFVEGAVLLVVL